MMTSVPSALPSWMTIKASSMATMYRLTSVPGFDVVATLNYGEQLEPSLDDHPSDVLLLDVNVPTSAGNPNPYPILHEIPNLLQKYPDLNILVISMYTERSLIRAVMEAGASGYVLKDDQKTIRDLGNAVQSVASGGIYFSHRAEPAPAFSERPPGQWAIERPPIGGVVALRRLSGLVQCRSGAQDVGFQFNCPQSALRCLPAAGGAQPRGCDRQGAPIGSDHARSPGSGRLALFGALDQSRSIFS